MIRNTINELNYTIHEFLKQFGREFTVLELKAIQEGIHAELGRTIDMLLYSHNRITIDEHLRGDTSNI